MKFPKSCHLWVLFYPAMRYSGLVLLLILANSPSALAQSAADPDFLRSTGKIYVVAAVCLIILLVILGYLVRLDRKISKLEKRQPHE